MDTDWSTAEIVQVVDFYNAVEQAFEKGINKAALLDKYQVFKKIVPSKMQEKQLDKQFNTVSGYSIYQAIQAARATTGTQVHIKEGQ
ncbi:hypothetical protein FC83_GL002485 [Agrilactobacillus composti DSM 18527 = JCM 14202]|uniref:Uncharacterized protein n=1 Tax=Agrilactobacillus composti DSM 18527 = JCM 14202 TaxID=1423734 RepID=A0A0R1YC17_9LACO|nr:hypothetical protein FC83_GL002485 [Agrilactobacillus composti DSM 18527 = JCM 14202]